MDPSILAVILSLTANGLTSLLASSSNKVGELLVGKEILEKWEVEKTALQPVLQKAIIDVAETAEWEGPAREEVVALFLRSPEVEEIVRQIYATTLIKDKSQNSFPAIRKIFLRSLTQFVTSYSAEADLKEEQLAEVSDLLFDTLLKACNLFLDHALDKGVIAAHEAKSAFRHHIIESEMAAIHKKLDFLVNQYAVSIRDILEFEKRYRQQVRHRHGFVIPPNFDSARKIPIDSLYVPPKFYGYNEIFEMEAFLSRIYRAVLLGNPGGGKSTFAAKLCNTLAINSSKRFLAGRRDITPILVILRDYGAEKKERPCSILEFIEKEAVAKYQLSDRHHTEFCVMARSRISLNPGLERIESFGKGSFYTKHGMASSDPPPGTFEYLFNSGRAAIGGEHAAQTDDSGRRSHCKSAFCC